MDLGSVTLMSLVPPMSESIICSDLSREQVALIQLNKSFLKKYEPMGQNRKAEFAALATFIGANRIASRWKPDEQSYHFDTMLRAKRNLHRRFYSGELQSPRITLARALDSLAPGPGASRGTKNTDFVGKVFCSRLTTYSRSLREYYKGSIPTRWRLAEIARERQFGGCEVIKASKLTYAKKNNDAARVINTEASLDMMFQKGIAAQIEDCLEDWFSINLSTQPTVNRWLAKMGSIYGSDATIDLKSASDYNSEPFMDWFLPPVLFKTLDTVRAKYIELPSGEHLRLSTFSTMGNGYTFALQTLVFSCIVEAAYQELGLPTDNTGGRPAFSVFGDDIICVKSAYDKVVGLLEWCGFVPNKDKSFNTGSFRESCGSDYFKGHDVRGVYLKRLYHETHVYSLFNRLCRWSIRNRVDVSNMLLYLKGLAVFRPIPFDEADISGFKTPYSYSGLRAGYGGNVRYRAVEIRKTVRRTTPYEFNPDALVVGALGGYIVGNGVSSVHPGKGALRSDESRGIPVKGPATGCFNLRTNPDGDLKVKQRRKTTTSWDWIPHKGLTILDYEMIFIVI